MTQTERALRLLGPREAVIRMTMILHEALAAEMTLEQLMQLHLRVWGEDPAVRGVLRVRSEE